MTIISTKIDTLEEPIHLQVPMVISYHIRSNPNITDRLTKSGEIQSKIEIISTLGRDTKEAVNIILCIIRV